MRALLYRCNNLANLKRETVLHEKKLCMQTVGSKENPEYPVQEYYPPSNPLYIETLQQTNF